MPCLTRHFCVLVIPLGLLPRSQLLPEIKPTSNRLSAFCVFHSVSRWSKFWFEWDYWRDPSYSRESEQPQLPLCVRTFFIPSVAIQTFGLMGITDVIPAIPGSQNNLKPPPCVRRFSFRQSPFKPSVWWLLPKWKSPRCAGAFEVVHLWSRWDSNPGPIH